MNVKNIEKREKNLVVMTIEIGAEEFEEAVHTAYRKNIGKMNVPGFRKGKAPRKIVEKIYGSGVFYEDAVGASYPAAYDAAVESEKMEPVERPDIKIESIGPEGYTFTASVHVYPEIEIGAYRGLSAYKPPVVVDESEIDAEIERLRTRNSSLKTAERPAAAGDTVIFDYEGFVDGVPFDGGKDERHSLELGSGRFIPGFEEGLAGVTAGQSLDVNIIFPEQYHAAELAGKPAVFKCLVHEVKETEKPELDDEFAKDVSEFDTLEELRKSIRDRFEHSREHASEDAFEGELLDQIIATMTGDIPDAMIDSRLDTMLRDLDSRLSRQGLDLRRYMEITGQSIEDVIGEYRPAAERQVKCSLIFDKVAALENMQVSDDELLAEYERLAGVYNMEAEKVRAALDEKSVRRDLLALKAAKLITGTAVILTAPKPADAAEADGMPSERFDKEHARADS